MKKNFLLSRRCCLPMLVAVVASCESKVLYADPKMQTIPSATPTVLVPNPVSSGIQLTARFDSTEYHVGDRILLKVIAKNTTNKLVYFLETAPAVEEFEISVMNSSGHAVPLTLWGRNNTNRVGGGVLTMNVPRLIYAGKDVTYQFILNRQFDMSLGGKYSVVVARPHVRTQDGKSTSRIVSNQAYIMLIEPEPEVIAPENVIIR